MPRMTTPPRVKRQQSIARQARYRERQRELGIVDVTVRVPKDRVKAMQEMAAALRGESLDDK